MCVCARRGEVSRDGALAARSHTHGDVQYEGDEDSVAARGVCSGVHAAIASGLAGAAAM